MIIPNYDKLGKKSKTTTFKELSPFYKQISRTLLCGPSGSGKTNLLMHIILSPLIYYDHITIYSKTIDQDKYLELDTIFKKIAKDSKLKPFHTFSNGTVTPVDDLDDKQYKLIVFDDYILEKKEFDKIIKYFVLGRHKKCNVIFLSQSYYNTPKPIRINCSNFCIFSLPTKRETKSVLTDHSGITEDMYKNATKGFDFLSINKHTKEITKNIDESID